MKMKKLSHNSWVVEIQKDNKTQELFVEFPPDCIDQVGWDIGDTIIWEELPDGGYSLKKKEDDGDREQGNK